METHPDFFEKQPPQLRECLLAMKSIVLGADPNITFSWKYGMPFFSYNGKMICYLWMHKKMNLPYLGIVEGKYFEETYLIQEKRARMKIMLVDPLLELPVLRIQSLVRKAVTHTRS